MTAEVRKLDKSNVELLEKLNSPYYIILNLLKKTGMKPAEAKLWAANYQYPQVADDIVGMIGHMLRRKPRSSNSPRRSGNKPED